MFPLLNSWGLICWNVLLLIEDPGAVLGSSVMESVFNMLRRTNVRRMQSREHDLSKCLETKRLSRSMCRDTFLLLASLSSCFHRELDKEHIPFKIGFDSSFNWKCQ